MLRRIFRTSDEAYAAKLKAKRQTPGGGELNDATPMAPPIGFTKQISLHDQMREMIRSERLRQEAEAQGMDTPEEADDFDIEDDDEPLSAYEYERYFEPHPPLTNVPGTAIEEKPVDKPDVPVAPVVEPKKG